MKLSLVRVERAVVCLLAAVVLGQFYYRAQSEAEVRNLIDTLRAKAKGEHILQPGSSVPRVRGVGPAGNLEILALPDSYVLVTLNEECLGVRANLDSWRRMQVELDAQHVPVVWLTARSSEAVKSFLSANGLDGVVLGDVPFDVYVGFGLGVVPQTLVIRDSTVSFAWTGTVDPDAVIRVLDKPHRTGG
jgi:hypothetical protein